MKIGKLRARINNLHGLLVICKMRFKCFERRPYACLGAASLDDCVTCEKAMYSGSLCRLLVFHPTYMNSVGNCIFESNRNLAYSKCKFKELGGCFEAICAGQGATQIK